MSFQGAPFPSRQAPIDAETQLFTLPLLTWFRNVRQSIDAAPSQVAGGKVQFFGASALTAAVGTTAIPTGLLAAGLYRVSWYAQVITPAGVSSDFQITISWTRNGVTQTFVGALKNANTTGTNEPSGPVLIHLDASTPVSYAVAYNSNPAAAMAYELSILLESVSEDS